MEILGIVLGLFFALLGFPIGLFLAKIAKEELKQGKKYFKIMLIVLAVLFVLTVLTYLFFGIELVDFLIIIYSIIFLAGLASAALVKAR